MQESSLAIKQRTNVHKTRPALSSHRYTERDVAAVWRVVKRLGIVESEADDVTQEVFLVAAQKHDKILQGKERAFLYGVALRVAKQHFNSAKRAHALIEVEKQQEDALTPEELVDQHKARKLLDQLLIDLPFELRSVFVLYEIEDLSTAEIAESLEIPQGTVASRLSRAREVFQKRVARWKLRKGDNRGDK